MKSAETGSTPQRVALCRFCLLTLAVSRHVLARGDGCLQIHSLCHLGYSPTVIVHEKKDAFVLSAVLDW